MPRTRTIKHGFFTNERLAEVEPLGRLLFAGMWTIADAAGRLPYRPKRIKALVLPYDDCDIDALTDELERLGFLQRYDVHGERYIAIATFAEHQRPHSKEPVSYPPPENGGTAPNPAVHEIIPAEPVKVQAEPGTILLNTVSCLLDTDYSNPDSAGPAPSSPLDALDDDERAETLELAGLLWVEPDDTTRMKRIIHTCRKRPTTDALAVAFDYAIWQEDEADALAAGKKSAKVQKDRVSGWANQMATKGAWDKYQRANRPETPVPPPPGGPRMHGGIIEFVPTDEQLEQAERDFAAFAARNGGTARSSLAGRA